MEGVEESSGRRRQLPTSISVRKRASRCTSSAPLLDEDTETHAAGPAHRAGSRHFITGIHHVGTPETTALLHYTGMLPCGPLRAVHTQAWRAWHSVDHIEPSPSRRLQRISRQRSSNSFGLARSIELHFAMCSVLTKTLFWPSLAHRIGALCPRQSETITSSRASHRHACRVPSGALISLTDVALGACAYSHFVVPRLRQCRSPDRCMIHVQDVWSSVRRPTQHVHY